MKTKVTLLLLSLFALGCSNDETLDTQAPQGQTQNSQRPAQNNIKNNVPTAQNKVLLLKVDYLTQAFEGGKLLSFPTTNGFSIASEYQSPGDFGGIVLRYAQNSQMIFSGTIHWAGLGQMDYPQNLDPAASFSSAPNPLPLPESSAFATVDYDPYAFYPDPLPLMQIWNAIDNLQLVSAFRASNPNAAINVFLYTPSVGIGNPEDWDYFVILKN